MPRKKIEQKREPSRAWAAYIAGHHLSFLMTWHRNAWVSREMFEKGRFPAIASLPPELDELQEAIALLSAAAKSRRLSFQQGKAIATWASVLESMIDDLSAFAHEKRVDWSRDLPPGFEQWSTLFKSVQERMSALSDLAPWFELGEQVAEREGEWRYKMPRQVREELLVSLEKLNQRKDFAFLGPLVFALGDPHPSRWDRELLEELVDPDPEIEAVTVGRVHAVLHRRLYNESVLPLVVIRTTSLIFFERTFQEGDFRDAEWPILRLLCRKAPYDINRQDLIQHGALKCKPKNLPPHITRIRKKLRPAVFAYYKERDLELPTHARACFILSNPRTKKQAKTFRLDILRDRVIDEVATLGIR